MSTARNATAEKQQDDSSFLVRRSFAVTVKSIDEKNRCVDVVASTDTLDAYDEVVDQSWDLGRYKKNPVVLYNHNMGTIFAAHPSATLPVGYSKECGVKMGQLEATLCFVDEKANPMAEMCWQGFLQGSLRAVSVGFNPRSVKSEKRDGMEFYRLSDNELYEISVCPMGANPDAVGKSKEKALEQLRLLEQRTKSPAAPAAKQEQKMDPKEIADLRAQLEEKTAALVAAGKSTEAAQAQVADLTAKLAAKTTEATELAAKILAAETGSQDAALVASVDALVSSKAITAVEKDEFVELARTSKSLFDKMVAKRRETGDRATKAEDDLLVKSVDDLVGVKIAPAEKEEFLELARSNKTLFDKMVAKRVDMKVLGVGSQLPAEKTAPTSPQSATNGEGLASLITEAHEADKTEAA